MPLSDSDLLVRIWAEDDRRAFEELVRRHQSSVRGLLRRLCAGDASRADDLAQETFLRAYQSIRSFRGESKFTSWLYRIAYNVFLAQARRRPDTPGAPELDGREATDAAHPAMLKYDLEKAMALLRPEERAALVLTYGQGLPHEEAASILDCPLGTLKTHVSRGKARLREILAAEGAPA